MKKFLAIALAVLMIAAMAIPAFAADEVRAFDDQEKIVTDEDTPEEADGSVDPNADKTQDFLVEYGVDQSYTVTIPADVFFDADSLQTSGDYNGNYMITRVVKADDVKIAGDETLTVKVASANEWTMPDTNGKSVAVDYGATIGTADEKFTNKEDNTVLTVEAPEANNGTEGRDGTATITFFTIGTAQEGNYRDVLTFTISVTEV